VGSFIRIGLGIEEGESSLCGGAPRAVIPGGILKCRDPACTHPKTYLWDRSRIAESGAKRSRRFSCVQKNTPRTCIVFVGLCEARRESQSSRNLETQNPVVRTRSRTVPMGSTKENLLKNLFPPCTHVLSCISCKLLRTMVAQIRIMVLNESKFTVLVHKVPTPRTFELSASSKAESSNVHYFASPIGTVL
jgi:hypothetical protein